MRRRSLLLIAGAALVSGCLSPTLPLPPPEEPSEVALGEDGRWEIRGRCQPGALVLVKNLDTGRIVGVEDRNADGRYNLHLAGELCDRAEVWILLDDDVSDRTFFLLEPTDGGLPQGACDVPG